VISGDFWLIVVAFRQVDERLVAHWRCMAYNDSERHDGLAATRKDSPQGWIPFSSSLASMGYAASMPGCAKPRPPGQGLSHVIDMLNALHHPLRATSAEVPPRYDFFERNH
jgi:hypothetical protein